MLTKKYINGRSFDSLACLVFFGTPRPTSNNEHTHKKWRQHIPTSIYPETGVRAYIYKYAQKHFSLYSPIYSIFVFSPLLLFSPSCGCYIGPPSFSAILYKPLVSFSVLALYIYIFFFSRAFLQYTVVPFLPLFWEEGKRRGGGVGGVFYV